MVRPIHIQISVLILFLCGSHNLFCQNHKFGFQELLEKTPHSISTFCVPNNEETILLLQKDKVQIKYATTNWLFISSTADWIDKKAKSQELKNYYFEFAPPFALADSALVAHHINPVHNGSGGLQMSYLGENTIIGYVDQGIDWNHPDFIDENGDTRVLRYWDQTINTGGTIAQPYNYGIVWDNVSIDNGTCFSTESGTAHGTTVAGMGSGNGNANGTNKGVAPKSNIIIVESNFNLPNWTLTVADACDYIFKVADSLGMPAVVNLSLGTYLGSHDGNDPASEYIEYLLDEKEGRIVICAAGNSGGRGKYHVTGNVDSDTSFVWLRNNPSASAAFGANKIYFDLWSDEATATYDFAFGADLPSPNYGLRGQTIFRGAQSSIDIVIYDTIYNSFGNRIATIETYTELVYGNYHMEVLFTKVDSTAYNFRFMTKGSGKYDLWSGSWLGLNDLVTLIPSTAVLPEIVHYHMPDSLQTIVSSWNCSNKVISVGNLRNRLGHIDNNGNQYYPAGDMTPPGKLSVSSSKGPNRHNLIKPDISAAGDVSLTAAPLWLLTNPSYNGVIDSGGWHARNGGTSMASPVVAGIAVLYLQKCRKSNYSNFKTDLIATSFADAYTGSVPNNGYGYGKPHAFNLLILNEFSANINGSNEFCADPVPLTASSSSSIMTALWSDGFEGITNNVTSPGFYSSEIFNTNGCSRFSDTIEVIQMNPAPMLPIVLSGNTLATLSFTTYQWTLNGVDIPGETSETLEIFPPYGTYTCYGVSDDGCISSTEPFTVSMGLNEVIPEKVIVYPNPTSNEFIVDTKEEIKSLRLFTVNGKEIFPEKMNMNTYSISSLPSGIYYIEIELEYEKIYVKIIRM